MRQIQLIVFCTCIAICGAAGAQETNPATTDTWPQKQQQQLPHAEWQDGVPVYRIQVVGRNIPAVNYLHRSGTTEIGLQGTSFLPEAKGSATVESRRGRTVIDAKFQGLKPANSFGVEYLTYVLWAITPEGRPVNLGEVLPDGSKGAINVTADLQAFGLIITAEPYYAVTMPSDLVVLQNYILPYKTQGTIEPINAHVLLLPRGAYGETSAEHTSREVITRNDVWPLELYEAVNAVQIAEAEGAGKYANDTLATAKQQLQNAEELQNHANQNKQEISDARAAVQTAEDARIITIRKRRQQEQAMNNPNATSNTPGSSVNPNPQQ
ncbi:hypothetical protein [Alloacidobacterium sp.]|uniref:hypothetical protein n=1 Tax=Alloacidobacterium sp. TaxID=2951999 RepID=UPI002D515D07|nr:hypothetical protein [Alloacidobacterium sp.]HYK35634.1 hypothetical protein [Alloacidobacterium sp.]